MASLFDLTVQKLELTNLKTRISIEEELILKNHLIAEQGSRLVPGSDVEQHLDHIQTKLKTINQINNEIQTAFDNLLHQLTVDIDKQAHERFKESKNLERFDDEQRLGKENNVIQPTEEDFKILGDRIDQYVNWRYPGLQLNCRLGLITRSLVGCDPLYVTDSLRVHPLTVVNQFTPQYQKRIRPYNVTLETLHQLPQNTFGLVVAWELFNYFTIGYIENYLKRIWELLRPGGVVIFTYNNCDLAESVRLAELDVFTWMPLRTLAPLCRRLGYEIVYTQNVKAKSDNYISWIELRRPGELKTIKNHQVLGKISNKNYD